MKLVKKRIFSFLIDYMLIIFYALFLSGISMLIFFGTGMKPAVTQPVIGQLVGFFTLTLPVFFYFYLFENGSGCATIGKHKLGLMVVNSNSSFSNPVLIRNALKFIPWEIAHTGVHWMVYYSLQDKNPPVWVMIVLIAPQLIVIAYVISIFATKGKRSIYDKVAGTKVEIKRGC